MENGKIKVLHYGLSDNNGGVEIDVLSWFRNKPDDFQFDFINDSKNPLAFQDEFESKGSKIFSVPFRYSNPIGKIRELNRIIKNGNYDFVHINTEAIDDGCPIVIANKTKGCRPIVHCHSANDKALTFKQGLLLLETRIMLLNQKYLKLSCGFEVGKTMFKDDCFEVIENGVDVEKFKYKESDRKRIRKQYNIKEDEIIIGHIGHACVEKNYPFIFEVFNAIKKEDIKVKLMLIGNSCYDEDILNLIDYWHINDDVVKVGMVNDTSVYYSAMDLFFLPSINEGVPLTAIEAQVSGLPCVISERVTSESKISELAVFTSLDVDVAKEKITMMSKIKNDRNKVAFDKRYDIKNSSKKLFDYYRSNLKDTYGK